MFMICIVPFLRFNSDHSVHGSYEDLSGGLTAAALQDSQVVFTETGEHVHHILTSHCSLCFL